MKARTLVALVLAALLTPLLVVLAAEDDPQRQDDEALLKASNVGTEGRALLDFFRKRTPDDAARRHIATLVEHLDSKDFAVRQAASTKLIELGPQALLALRGATRGTGLELTRRAEQCIDEIERGMKRGLAEAAVRRLAAHQPAGAAEVLLNYLPSAEAEDCHEETLDALVAVGLRDGRPDALLVTALNDKDPLRRAAAALVVGRSTDADQRAAVKALLADAEPRVRLGAARGLAFGREKDAVPVLIALLEDAPLPLGRQAEDLLVGIAGDQAPSSGLGGVERRKCRQEWEAWWAKAGAQVDMARIDSHRPPRLPEIPPVPKDRKPDVIYVPTPQEVVDRALELAKLRKRDVVYDLGCGDGRVVITAARKYGTYGFGFEIDPTRVRESLENVQRHKVGRLVTIKLADAFTLDLREATVIYLYMLPSLNRKLIPQLEKCRPGTRIISHSFDMEGVKPDEVVTVKVNAREHRLYLWTTPLKKE